MKLYFAGNLGTSVDRESAIVRVGVRRRLVSYVEMGQGVRANRSPGTQHVYALRAWGIEVRPRGSAGIERTGDSQATTLARPGAPPRPGAWVLRPDPEAEGKAWYFGPWRLVPRWGGHQVYRWAATRGTERREFERLRDCLGAILAGRA